MKDYVFVEPIRYNFNCVRPSGFVPALICTMAIGFKVIWHSCCPQGVEVPFETFVQVC